MHNNIQFKFHHVDINNNSSCNRTLTNGIETFFQEVVNPQILGRISHLLLFFYRKKERNIYFKQHDALRWCSANTDLQFPRDVVEKKKKLIRYSIHLVVKRIVQQCVCESKWCSVTVSLSSDYRICRIKERRNLSSFKLFTEKFYKPKSEILQRFINFNPKSAVVIIVTYMAFQLRLNWSVKVPCESIHCNPRR